MRWGDGMACYNHALVEIHDVRPLAGGGPALGETEPPGPSRSPRKEAGKECSALCSRRGRSRRKAVKPRDYTLCEGGRKAEAGAFRGWAPASAEARFAALRGGDLA